MRDIILFLPVIVIILLNMVRIVIVNTGRSAEERRAAIAAEKKAAEAEAARRQREIDKAHAEAYAKRMAQKYPEPETPPKRRPGRPRKDATKRPEIIPTAEPAPVAEPEPAPAPAPVMQEKQAYRIPVGNAQFAGQRVSFTGKIPGMTRREAIAAVIANGGKAFESMPVGTTLLVVGENPGNDKLDKADRWISTCRKITVADFKWLLRTPLSLDESEFIQYIAARAAQ